MIGLRRPIPRRCRQRVSNVPIPVLFAVLCAAFLHASWNALVRSSGDRLRSATVLQIAIGLFALLFLPAAAPIAAASWACVVASAAIHVVYTLLLVRAYEHGDLSVAYPVARGTAPLLVTLGAAAFAGERLSAGAQCGLVLICAGIMAIGLERRAGAAHRMKQVLPIAFATGVSIAAYSVVDGIGVRESGSTIGYAAWTFVLTGALMAAYYRLRAGPLRLAQNLADTAKAACGGVFAALAYAIVIWAMARAPMGPVSALRETSVVFAALIARVYLGERLTPRRAAGCAVIAGGALLISAFEAVR
ncbi:Permease of the drug/metabolite transporter (DMT) superfamily [Burkholderia vietnamiensis]|jgi:drug/metabolite transporter (DMT)-like permease|nr:EamA family transporter [Burkholderia vietnamiensis]AFJ88694.1 Permease of the drug/metabolite transporter (DMT) superfamily [Burkholderia sp. KJ006]TCT33178.1 drug/metabolite transporter (DMT)-like permease [Burkholderia vietnamiensis]CAG9193086.1 Permease of the drug/metabolite transporter (DMT) superfamily [Burkholderia vietnamiensis]SCZ23113.1 Permease of the drug/metabolite transporter (DMT) superfamily [Burkholderia vietnamiensis]SFX29696.1 Permease of the drug/metabolite transporter 